MNDSSTCVRGDGQDLVWNWMQHQKAQGRLYRYVKTKEQLFDEGLVSKTDYLLGKDKNIVAVRSFDQPYIID